MHKNLKIKELDLRRLEFIASWFEEIILSECKFIDENLSSIANGMETEDDEDNLLSNLVEKHFLKELLEYRKQNTEMCNMTLLLLIVKIYRFIDFFLNTNFIRLFSNRQAFSSIYQ